MKRLVLLVLFFAGLAAANPVAITLLSEFSADSAHQWLELCPLPGWCFTGDTFALTGWRVVTSTSACTLNYVLSRDSPFVVIDSTGLATHQVGSGSFRLRPDSDFIDLYGTGNPWPWNEYVNYPVTPTDAGNSLAPPQHCSAAFWNYDGSMSQCFNWYIDSMPTPGDFNTHYSTIAGSVIVEESLVPSSELLVEARGEHAYCCFFEAYDTSDFAIGGLGAGWYHLEAYLFGPHGEIHRYYPDSVEVGYNQTVSGISIDLRAGGVAERARPMPSVAPVLQVRGAELDVLCPAPADIRLAVFDLTGACRAMLHEGLLEPGVHRFDLASRVRTGVYFIQLTTGRNQTTRKVVVMR
jgi:hypothetical protein